MYVANGHIVTTFSAVSAQYKTIHYCALSMASMQANEMTFSQGPSVFKV